MKIERGDIEELARDQFGPLVRVAFLITGNREEARDLAQEALARAVQHWRTVCKLDAPEAWLHRVVANLAISSRRRSSRLAGMPIPSERIVEVFAGEEDQHLQEGLSSLTPAQRAVLVLRFYLDWSVADTAKALGKKPGTVRALTSQGIARLREFMPEREVQDDIRE